MALLAHFFRAPFRALALSFVEHFGLAGMVAGTFIADALSFPVPPQAYMSIVVASGQPPLVPLTVISLTSMCAGAVGYRLAGSLARFAFFRRLLERTKPRVDQIFERWRGWAIVIASISPIPFSTLCYIAGLYRMPPRLFALFLLLRVPRLFLYFALILLSW